MGMRQSGESPGKVRALMLDSLGARPVSRSLPVPGNETVRRDRGGKPHTVRGVPPPPEGNLTHNCPFSFLSPIND
jgi:hypothetical protein